VFFPERSEFKASIGRRKEKMDFYSKKVALPTRMLLELSFSQKALEGLVSRL
jgi:hypothetical protein